MTQLCTERKKVLARFLPAPAVDPVDAFVEQYKLRLRFVNARKSKLGDYRCPNQQKPYHAITVDGTVKPSFCLMVLLHEMAHLLTFVKCGHLIRPHGCQWQEQYASLLSEYVQFGAFPENAVPLINRYAARLPLNRKLGMELEHILRDEDLENQSGVTYLNNLQPGDVFELADRPGSSFRAVAKRRTRWLCRDIRRNVDCLVLGYARVNKQQ